MSTESHTRYTAAETESNEPVDLTGRTIGEYELIRRLGRGGMAEVYLANQKSLGRQVAFKTLKAELARDRKYIERFHREAKAAAGLNQANIVQIYEVGEADGVHYIVQEYIRGQNLKQYLHRHSVCEPILAVNVVRQVASALQKASEQGIIHRDIKPENIMLTPDGEVKVTDFGLARVMAESQTDLTQIGVTMGTPLYMSPEQIEGRAVDPRSDIYSLGVTTFHMLVGRPPFEGDNPLTLAVQHAQKTPPPIAKLRPDLPAELCQIVETMLAKQPDDRFQNPQELLKAIRAIDVETPTDWDVLAERLRWEEDATERPTVQHQLAATRKLATVMSAKPFKWWQRPVTWAVLGVLMFTGLVTGSIAALAPPPPEFFPENENLPPHGIAREPTVAEQYRMAYFRVGRDNNGRMSQSAFEREELAWKSVRAYFRPGEASDPAEIAARNLWCRRADERLGELYIRYHEWDKALEIYESLVNVEAVESRFRTVGLAGKAVVYSYHLGEHDVARLLLFAIEPDLDELNGFMRAEIEMLNQLYYGENG